MINKKRVHAFDSYKRIRIRLTLPYRLAISDRSNSVAFVWIAQIRLAIKMQYDSFLRSFFDIHRFTILLILQQQQWQINVRNSWECQLFHTDLVFFICGFQFIVVIPFMVHLHRYGDWWSLVKVTKQHNAWETALTYCAIVRNWLK